MANYIDLFDSYPVASGLPSGWTNRWNTPVPNWEVTTDSLGGNSLRCLPASQGRFFASFDAINGDAGRAACDVLVLVSTSTVTGSLTLMGAVGRGAGAGGGAETGYVCNFFGSELRLIKYVSGAVTELGITSGFGVVANAWYWIRLRCNGTTIQAKGWANGSAEPGSWNFTVTDTSISAAGWCGFFGFGSPSMRCAQIAVATGGDTATFDAGGGPTIYRPVSDVDAGGWTVTGAASVAAAIGESSASDAEYATSPDLLSPAIVAANATIPAGTYTARFRAQAIDGAAQARVRYLDASNVDVGGTAWQALTSAVALYELPATLSAPAVRKRLETQ